MAEFLLDGTSFRSGSLEPGLYIVATPIGNLSDISIRALKTLAGVDLIACEDTRVTATLLNHFGIKTKMLPYHRHNAARAGRTIKSILDDDKSVALVSDAGTPLISDPGNALVASALENNIAVFPIPGANAPLTALVASGLPADSFMFNGFLPTKSAARQTRLRELANLDCTLIFFESPNRLAASVKDMEKIFGGERRGAVCREMTKLHEEFSTANLQQLAKNLAGKKIRGEIVIIIAPPPPKDIVDVDKLLLELMANMTLSRAAAEAAKLTGETKRHLYQRALQLSENFSHKSSNGK